MSNYSNADLVTNDLRVITGAKYGSMRKLSDLHALQILCETLAIKLAAQPAESNELSKITPRQLRLIERTLDMHYVRIKKRIAQVERMNESKASRDKMDKDRVNLVTALLNSGVLKAMVNNQREVRSEAMRDSKEQAQQARAALIPAIQRQFAEVGFDPRAPSAERAEWERLRDINRHAIPGTDLSTQGDEIMQRMSEIEQERTNTEAQPSRSNTDDISTVGTADEWSKLI